MGWEKGALGVGSLYIYLYSEKKKKGALGVGSLYIYLYSEVHRQRGYIDSFLAYTSTNFCLLY